MTLPILSSEDALYVALLVVTGLALASAIFALALGLWRWRR